MAFATPEKQELARAVVARVAHDELELFDEIWDDYVADPSIPVNEADMASRKLGLGGLESQSTFVTLIVIPLVVQLGGALLKASVAEIVEWLKRRFRETPNSNALSDEDIRRIAVVVVEEARRRKA